MDDAQTLHIISRAKKLENLLRRAGAIGNGLRELSESMGDALNDEERKLFRYAGALRNQAAHEIPEENSAPADMKLFDDSCDVLESKLLQLQSVEPDDPVGELQDRAETFFRRCGYIPVIGIFFPLRLLYASIRPGAGLATALVFGVLAILPLPRAFAGERYIFCISGILYLLSYLYGIWHALRKTPTTSPKALSGIPLVSLLYLLWSLIDVIKWDIFPGALLLTIVNLLPYGLVRRASPVWAVAGFVAAFFITAAATARWKVQLEVEKDL